ncbi:MAG: glycosyltransferase [Verrucomicrobia bacterium]|nr:glycosyltransferase [Verrucomicrobiota bacterium]MBV8486352.1 glycosyltransferase [Verrucomicrobiota bacterium]
MSALLQVQDGSINQSTNSRFDGTRVAIVHHWLVSFAGGERVVDTMAGMFPSADIFTLFLDEEKLSPALRGREITTSFLDRIPGARRVHRHCLPLYPLAVEMLDLSGYDLVITSDSGPMKGVITDLDATHICYCHSPMRYLWDGYSAYRRGMSSISKIVFELTSHYVRNWDYLAAQRVDHFIANSGYVARRIHKYYRRRSTIIHPPIDTSRSYLSDRHDDYYLAVGRLVPYKRTDILIGACQKLDRKLVIVGDGPEMERLKKSAGKNVEFVGETADEQLKDIYARCRALLFAADEDFGMVPLEAQSYGRPVIAYGKGGSLETVVGVGSTTIGQQAIRGDSITGIFFEKQSTDSLADAMLAFESSEDLFAPEDIQSHARRFDTSVFVERFQNYILWAKDNREDISESAITTNEFEDAQIVQQIA